jgi:hypothetical protein
LLEGYSLADHSIHDYSFTQVTSGVERFFFPKLLWSREGKLLWSREGSYLIKKLQRNKILKKGNPWGKFFSTFEEEEKSLGKTKHGILTPNHHRRTYGTEATICCNNQRC